MKNESKNNLLEGSIVKSIFTIIIPVILANLLQVVYNLTDTYFVGRLGEVSVAAVSASFPMIFLIIAFSFGIGMAGNIMISRAKGEKKIGDLSNITFQTILMAFIVSVILSVFGYIFSSSLVGLLGVDVNVLAEAVVFLQYSFIGLPFVFGYMVFQGIARGVGKPKIPFYIVLITVFLNFLIDPLFIFGFGFIPAMGSAGAAIATMITQAIAFIIGLMLLFRGTLGFKLRFSEFQIDVKLIKKMFMLGLPMSFEQSTRAIEMVIMTGFVAVYGTTVLAGYGIGSRIFSFVIIPAISLAITNSILVGQNLGAKNHDRVDRIVKASSKIGFIFLSFVGIVLFFTSESIARFFIPNEPAAILVTVEMIKYMAISFGFIGVQMSILGAFKGGGATKLSMYVAMIILCLQISLAYFLPIILDNGEIGIWMSYPISQGLGMIICLFCFLNFNWKKELN